MDAIQSYVYRGQQPRPLAQPSPKRITTPASARLDTIMENGNARAGGPQSPQTPQRPGNTHSPQSPDSRLTNMPGHRSSLHGLPPELWAEKRPPSYATNDGGPGSDLAGASGEPEKEPGPVKRVMMRRGGWKRLVLFLLLALLVIALALGLGLGLGLTHKSSKKNTSSSSNPSSTTPTGPFPIGAYAITAFLTNTSTSCTSNAATWTCYPYTLYSSSPSSSEAPFDWQITKAASSSKSEMEYVISSATNPLAISFSNASLTLLDTGLSTERYTFSVPNLIKNVIPAVSLTGDGSLATCFYNSTTLRASLYTKMTATLTDSGGSAPTTMQSQTTSDGVIFNQAWPGAVMVEWVASGGTDVPNCYRLENGRPSGNMINLATEAASTQCSCVYSDFGNG